MTTLKKTFERDGKKYREGKFCHSLSSYMHCEEE